MAVIVTFVEELTVLVEMLKVPEVCPCATVMLAGIVKEVFEFAESCTTCPLIDAGLSKVIVPIEELPPINDDGETVNE